VDSHDIAQGNLMGKLRSETPDTWEDWKRGYIKHAGDDIYYCILEEGIVKGGKADNVWVWHWHTPLLCRHCGKLPEADGDHSCPCPKSDEDCTEHPSFDRWHISACGKHTVLQVEPLTLDPSLACYDGCPSHGWLKNGVWDKIS